MKTLKFVLLLLVVTLFTGCPDEEVARKASTQLIAVQVEQNRAQAQYFATIENFLDAQLGITVQRVDEITEQIRQRYALKLRLLLEANPNALPEAREAIISGVMKEINDDAAENEAIKRQIAERVVALKEFHKEFLANQQAILQAQQQLDQYIQLGSGVNRLIVERTLDKVREKASNATSWLNKASEALAQVRALIAPRKAVAK